MHTANAGKRRVGDGGSSNSKTKGNDNLLEVQILHRSDYSREGERDAQAREKRGWLEEGGLLEKASTRIA